MNTASCRLHAAPSRLRSASCKQLLARSFPSYWTKQLNRFKGKPVGRTTVFVFRPCFILAGVPCKKIHIIYALGAVLSGTPGPVSHRGAVRQLHPGSQVGKGSSVQPAPPLAPQTTAFWTRSLDRGSSWLGLATHATSKVSPEVGEKGTVPFIDFDDPRSS